MENLFLIDLVNDKSFDLGKVDILIGLENTDIPEELCSQERSVEDVIDYVVIDIIRKTLAQSSFFVLDADTDITLQTTISDLGLDSFDRLELLAKVEVLLDDNIFDVDMQNSLSTLGDIASEIKETLIKKK